MLLFVSHCITINSNKFFICHIFVLFFTEKIAPQLYHLFCTIQFIVIIHSLDFFLVLRPFSVYFSIFTFKIEKFYNKDEFYFNVFFKNKYLKILSKIQRNVIYSSINKGKYSNFILEMKIKVDQNNFDSKYYQRHKNREMLEMLLDLLSCIGSLDITRWSFLLYDH